MGSVIKVNFNPGEHPRGRDGQFASKPAAAEAGIDLVGAPSSAQPPEQAWGTSESQQQWCSDATAAMAPPPERLPARAGEDYDLAVSRAIEPGLDAREAAAYAELMRGDDPELAHRFYSTVSLRRISEGDAFDRADQRERVTDGLEYLAVDHYAGDRRIPAAVAAICPPDHDERARELKWARFVTAANLYRLTPSTERGDDRHAALDELMRGHPAWQ